MSAIPITFTEFSPPVLEQLQVMLRGPKGDTGDVTPEALAAKQAAQNAASASASKAEEAAGSASGAVLARVGAESARDSALIQAGVYVDEPTGRAAVADGVAFKVQGSGDVAASEYRRTNSVSSALIATYPSSQAANRALSVTDRLSLKSYKLFKQRAGLLKAKVDVSGALRVLESSSDGVLTNYYGVPVNALSKSQLSIATTRSLPLLKTFPSSVDLIPDANGGYRVLKAVDIRRPGQPVLFGAQNSNSVPVPTEFYVFLSSGQSNADGRGNSLQSPAVPAGVAYQFFGGLLSPLVDPVGTAATGSLWPAFAIEFWKRTGFGVIVVPAAVGGSSVVAAAQPASNWDTTGTLRAQAISRLNSTFAYLDANGYAWQYGGQMWWEGEQAAYSIDHAVAGVTKATYKTAFQNMVAANVADIGHHPLLVIRVGRESAGDTTGYQQIRAAQNELCKEVADARMAFTGVFNFPARGLMNGDGTLVHVGQAGLNEVGKKLATVTSSVCIGQS